MDIGLWLNDMQHFYDTLCALDDDCMSEREFTRAVINNTPKTEGWRIITSGYRNTIDQYDKVGTPVKSAEFISKIRDENLFHTRDNPQSSSYIFSAHADADKQAQKRKGPPDSSSSGNAMRPSDHTLEMTKPALIVPERAI
jgi:hypothetical protein